MLFSDDKVAPPRNCAKGSLYWNYPHGKVDIEFRRLSLLPDSTNQIKVCLKLVTEGRIDVTRTARKGRIVDMTPLEGLYSMGHIHNLIKCRLRGFYRLVA